MKRIIAFIVCMSLLSTAYSQTQNKIDGFWGMKFGQILTKEDIQRIQKKCRDFEIEKDLITCFDVDFAGKKFDIASIHIFKGRLFEGIFGKAEDYDRELFLSLFNSLTNKYGKCVQYNDSIDAEAFWIDNIGIIALSYDYITEQHIPHCTSLRYIDNGELSKIKKREEYNDL